jgi:hypothetical protein
MAAIVAGFMACVLIAHDASDSAVIVTFFCAAIMVAAMLGVFDTGAIKRDMKHTSIKDAARYGQAAVFIGTACLYVGTPQECDELADDLWHYAQQAEVRALTGDETFDVL